MTLSEAIGRRVLLLDGAFGTMVQAFGLTEADFRGEWFANHPLNLSGNNDVLAITRPDVVEQIHRGYLEAGADIITTCSFNSQRISQADYGLEDYVDQLNTAAAKIARRVADEYGAFVVGSVGPTTRLLSISSDPEDAAARAVSFDQMHSAYVEQIRPLLRQGVDAIMVETALDVLNAKAALMAAEDAMAAEGRQVPLMLSLTVTDASGHILSGQSIEAVAVAVANTPLLTIGINCSMGAEAMGAPIRRLAEFAPWYITMHPNAGLPNELGQYDDTPQKMARALQPLLADGVVNVIGGCCGTTPDYIRQMRKLLDQMQPSVHQPAIAPVGLALSSIEPLIPGHVFVNVGERCNVAGSRKFLRLIKEKNYDEAVEIARKQIRDGAMLIDINMDDALLDAPSEMERFIRLISADAEVAAVPVMIDSSDFAVIERGLKSLQGKGIVNSISLKDGEDEFVRRASVIRRYGAAVVVMAFDEQGQATSLSRRIEICERAYRILTQRCGYNPSDIIFDPNVLTVATGIDEHLDYAHDFVEATRWIKSNLPGCRVSGGVSNLSFAFRGNNYLREAMHAVFLYRAKCAGMDMAIMNPASSVAYSDLDPQLVSVIEDALFNERTPRSVERLIDKAQEIKAATEALANDGVGEPLASDGAPLTLSQRLKDAIVKGSTTMLSADLPAALDSYPSPLDIIAGPLMEGMTEVGSLFGQGKMFLPQVVKTARAMKHAVEFLQPHIEAALSAGNDGAMPSKAGKIMIATVKGDVHDIGKNIVGVILSCNNYEVIDLGVMVPPEDIVAAALHHRPDIICLSGLITPSLDAMCRTAKALADAGIDTPLMIGGATTSELHTAVKIAPLYRGVVLHMHDAAQNPAAAARLMDASTRAEFIEDVYLRQQQLRNRYENETAVGDKTQRPHFTLDWSGYTPPMAPFMGVGDPEFIPIGQLIGYINWTYFYHAWKVKPDSPQASQLRADALAMLATLESTDGMGVNAITGYFEAQSKGDTIRLTIGDHIFAIATPRQQQSTNNKPLRALSDYVSPHADVVGIFAATVSPTFTAKLDQYKHGNDSYAALLMHTIGDRLVEAASEYMHLRLQQRWRWQGIRPAVGYPSLPDQSVIFTLDAIMHFDKIGITLTETGAMSPASSVAGLYISHPFCEYFDAAPRP